MFSFVKTLLTRIAPILICILFSFPAYSQEVKNVKLKNMNSETEDFLVYLQGVPQPDQQYVKCFSMYAVPPELLEDAVLQLSFIIHSLAGTSSEEESAGSYYPLALAKYDKGDVDKPTSIEYLRKVPNSDTLFYIDIRDYNWTVESFEKVSKFDGYTVEPVISGPNSGLLRLLSGNAIFRGDWFIFHAARSVAQTDKDSTKISIYRELLYSKTTAPKTVSEFRTTWGLTNIENSRRIGNEYGTLVTKSKNVVRHNRMLFGYRTEIGWMYITYDVKNEAGKRDYVERFYEFGGKPPDTFDGGEIFASNVLQLQVYDLYNDKEELVDFADATIVRHLTDILGDTRVSVAHSCFDCHAEGPIPSENTIAEFLKNNGGIAYKERSDKLRVDRAFYNKRFEDSIDENQVLYKKALSKVNGLNPKDNIKSYYKMINWYAKPVDLEQAAVECGVTVDILKQKAKEGLQDVSRKIPGRLALLLQTGEAIPREIWEAPNTDGIPGTFQQAMIMINGLTKITTTTTQQNVKIVNVPITPNTIPQNINKPTTPKPDQNTSTTKFVAQMNAIAKVYNGQEVIKTVPPLTKIVEIVEETPTLMLIILEDGTKGWVESQLIAKTGK